jgi:hypothetical protein
MRRASLIPFCLAAAACVTSQTLRLDQSVRPARAPESVLVLEQAPEQPYSVIARVESKAGSVFRGFDDLRLRLLDQAAQLGGDALIVGPESTTTEFIILTTGLIPSETKRLTGEVIIFR